MKMIFTFDLSKRLLFTFFYLLITTIFCAAQNAIVSENANPGNPISEWGVPDFRDNRITGFANKMSLNNGETVRFKINVQSAAAYTIKVYRIGYYGGNGARLMQNLGSFSGTVQPAGISDPATGILDCSNWSVSASWAIPSNAVSGFYIAKIERTGGGSNHIAFIVRNDASHSDLYLQMPDATWQAYNGYGGNSVYDGNTSFPSGHAVKVSYNRPFFPYNSLFNTDGREADWYMNAEYPMIRWLERNGYDISYTSCNDVDKNGARLLNHKVFISLGHDEYWSKKQRENVEAARNAGVHLAFFSGNEVYWKTRWENNDGTEDRTLVCYKEGLLGDGSLGERACGSKCDPSTEWTGLWRTGAAYDAGKPENSLIGQMSWVEYPSEIGVPASYKKIRFWRNSSVQNLTAGQTASLGVNTLGYEWDYEHPEYASFNPPGRITMSSKTVNNLTHKLSLYRHASGALVFGAGTVQWSWGLDGQHWGGSTTVSKEMQQATVNLFADMNVQPGNLQADLTAAVLSTDLTSPTAVITSPANNASFLSGATITITGTATDAGGGVVAAVEISTDAGNSWKSADISSADGNITWTYTFSNSPDGVYVVKARGVDDSGNIGNPGSGVAITIGTVDNTAPTILSVLPGSGSSDIGVSTVVTANFDEAINSSSVTNTTFQLRDANNAIVSATLTVSSNKITITPSTALSASTVYTATIKGGAAGIKDLSGNSLASDYSWSFTTGVSGACPCTVFQPSDAPSVTANNNDGQGIALGMRFRTTQNGFITGVRYYKGEGTTGTHTGSLWSNTGTLMAQANFSNETASGWQEVSFNNPVAVTAGITYVVSYFSPSGDYVATKPYFTEAVINGPLRGLADGEDGANGLYMYSASMAFPVNSFQSSHYWVDVVFNTNAGADITPPVISSVSPQNNATGVGINSTIIANFSENINSSTVNGSSFHLKDAAGNNVAATISVSFNQLILTPSAPLTASSVYTVTIRGGVSGIKDLSGNALVNDYTWSFTAGVAGICPCTVFHPSDAPAEATNHNDEQGIALGMRFRTTQDGFITGVRYYKGEGATGTHTGSLWSNTGTLMAQANFANESASGWQEVSFSNPVAVTAGVTYVVSYFSPSGDYVATKPYFTEAVVNGPLRGLADGEDGANGLFMYSSTVAFPLNSFQASHYWVDVVFNTAQEADIVAPVITLVSPVNAATAVGVNSNLSAIFNEAMNVSTMSTTSIQLRNSSNVLISGTVSYNASNNTVTLTPSSTLDYSTVYTATIAGGFAGVKDLAGNAMVNNYTWSFTTVPAPGVGPVLSTQPVSQVVCAGVNVSFSSAATGSPVPTVQWQLSLNGTSWSNINGATNSTFSFVSAATDNNKQYRAVWTNATSSVNSNSAILTVNAIPAAPGISIVNNCSNSTLTATSFTGSLLWSNSATTPSITVTAAGAYTVKQTVSGCTSVAANATAVPKPVPSLTSNLSATATTGVSFSYTPSSSVTGTSFSWSRAMVTGKSNAAASGTGSISETLINTGSSPVIATYVYTLSANGCSNTQNVSVTVNPVPTYDCKINGSLTSSFTSTAIPAGRYIWFNSVLDRQANLGLNTVNITITNSKISFTANNQAYTLDVPNATVSYDPLVLIASTQFVNNVWVTKVPRTYADDVFMTGLSYLVPVNFAGGISNIRWTADISIDQTGAALSWKWAAATYTKFASHSGLNVKPIGGLLLNPYLNLDLAGTPENYKSYLVAGAKSTGGSSYTGSYSTASPFVTCSTTGQRSAESLTLLTSVSVNNTTALAVAKFVSDRLDAEVTPNPSNSFFSLVVKGSPESPVTVRVMDIFGRVIEQHEKVATNTTLRIGHKWLSGSYFAELIQNGQRKIVKMIKAK